MNIKRILSLLILFSLVASIAACQEPNSPNLADRDIRQGDVFYDKKQYSKAIPLYEKAAKENPNDLIGAVAHYKKAMALNAMNKYGDAISECSKSIAIDPLTNKGFAYLLRGILYEKTGKYIEAASDYSKALIINPDYKEAGIRRQRLLIGIYTKFTNEGLAAFTRGLAAYNKKENASARKYLDKASLLFAAAMNFDIGDKTAFTITNFTKGLMFQMIANDVLATIKPESSNREAKLQLVKAYYPMAIANAYYKKASSLLKNEKLKNWLTKLKAVNDKNMDMLRPRIDGLESWSDKYTKAADLEGACIVNFDAASYSISAGDHDGAKGIIDEIDNTVSELRRTKSANALGIGYLSNAYAVLNTIFSYPLTNRSWLKKNKAILDEKIDECLKDLASAKSALVTKELVNNCSRVLKTVSALKDMFKKMGNKL